MAKTPAARKSELAIVLARIEALEERIKRLEGEAQAAIAVAADFDVRAVVPVPAAPELPLPAAAPVAPGAGRDPEVAGEVSEEILLVLSAAVAAFLGERAHIRQVRLVHSDAWAQQGRVSVMASHRWAVHR